MICLTYGSASVIMNNYVNELVNILNLNDNTNNPKIDLNKVYKLNLIKSPMKHELIMNI